MVIETRLGTTADIDRAGDVLADAFADYPWTRWTVDGDDHRRRIGDLQRMAIEHFGLAHGQVWVTTVDSVVESVAVWMDSAVEVPSAVYAEIEQRVAELEGSRHAASRAADRELQPLRPVERHHVLGTIGTSIAMQRRGLATRTLAPGLARADRDHIGAYLETSSEENVTFYRSLGFEVCAQHRVTGGGPTVWAMRRGPQP